MRVHGRRYIQRKIQRNLNLTAETRDGILWDIDWDNFIARVKIQGSNEYVNVHFPRNEATVSGWMRPGNAVRVIHRGGVRGYSEIVGHGYAIPTPVPGQLTHPQTSDLADGIISGCEVTASGNGMDIDIANGTYRISGTTYNLSGGSFGYPIMSEANPLMTMHETYPPAVMGDPIGINYVKMDESSPPMTISETFPPATMGLPAGTYTLDAAPSQGQFRYDAFVVGENEIIDYIKGTAAASPTKPSIPSNHILLGDYILVIGAITEITDEHIGLQWSTPAASELSIPSLSNFSWDSGNDYPEATVTVQIRDQYGWLISGSYSITLNMLGGTGNVYSVNDGYDPESVTQSFTGSSYGFKYRRDQTEDPEISPAFMATSSNGLVSDMEHMTLLDANGDPVTGIAQEDEASTEIQTLTSASNVAIDWTLGHRAKIIAGHDITFTMSGAADFDKLILMIKQDGTGSRTITWPSNVKYGTEITSITISSAANSISYVGFIYDSATSKYNAVANVRGYV